MNKIIYTLTIFLASCAIQPKPIPPMPSPAPARLPNNFCTEGQTKDCREWTADDKSGLTSGRGHGVDVNEKP